MRQLFNKSGMIIVFHSAVLTLCTILLSLFFNIGSSDITDRFSDDAVLLEITQDNYSDNALSYSDIADILAKNKARGAMLINASGKGYALFNYSDSDLSYALMNSDDIRSDTPKAVVSTQKLTQTMDIGGKQTINLFSSDHEVIGTGYLFRRKLIKRLYDKFRRGRKKHGNISEYNSYRRLRRRYGIHCK